MDGKQHVLVTDHVHQHLLSGLVEMGFLCNYQPEITLARTQQIIGQYDGVVINSKIKATAAFLQAATRLKFIARLGSGLDIIDLDEAARRQIAVISAPEGNCNAVSEHALGMLLSLLNHLHRADRQVREFEWRREENRGEELDGKTVGIIGFGHTGPAFATKLRGFDVNVLATDPKVRQIDLSTSFEHVSMVDLPTIQREADIVSFHTSLNPTSHHLFDINFIDLMARPFYLINTSRGKVVKIADLLVGLGAGKVKGAGLDVFENEKTATFSDDEKALYSRLYKSENVILTPHVAGWTHESKWKIADVLLKKISQLPATNNI